MQLSKYPGAIATLELQVLAMSKEVESLTNQIKNIEGDVDLSIGQNAELKNDTQRKGLKAQILQAHPKYNGLLQTLNIQQGNKLEKEIELRKICNMFSVAKLELQLEIAKINQASAA